MAGAGPSSPVASISKHSRITNDSFPSETSSKSIGLGPPPIFRNTTQGTENRTRRHRRRIKSEDPHLNNPVSKDLRSPYRMSMNPEKRPVRIIDAPDSGLGAFSDEYDLAHEDPGIMEDVQRALMIKARRDARLKALSNSPGKDSSKASEASPRSSFSTGSSPAPLSFPPIGTTFPPISDFGGESEVDFSPSVGATVGHPVPRSTDDGATLDWSGDPGDEKFDRRWSLSIPRRKPKDRPTASTDKPIAENQGYIYTERLARIKSRAKPLTLRKATMTADQLQRRYGILYASLSIGPAPINLASIVEWHTSQDSLFRNFLERSEPSTWLKHLDRKPAKRNRLSWNVTALIVEEYMKAQLQTKSMQTIPEDSAVTSPDITNGSTSRANMISGKSPHKSPNPSLLRRSHEGPEPFIDPGRDLNSRRNENSHRSWIQSLQSDTDSQQSSIYSVFKPRSQVNQATSPASSRLNIRSSVRRKKSEEFASARNSLSEGHSQPEDSDKPRYNRHSTNLEPTPESGQLPSAEMKSNLESIPIVTQGNEGTSPNDPRDKPRPVFRRIMRSFPSSDRFLYKEGEKRQQQADEEKERQEYEIRSQLLEVAVRQNHRIRHIMQRVTGEIKEFDGVQSSFSELLGVPCLRVPQEVLDALSHDPAAVTGSTRRLRGWRAVEDIHARLAWQRELIHSFVQSLAGLEGRLPMPTGIFDDSLALLMSSVARLEEHRHSIIDKADEVTDILTRVREMHGIVKTEFNDTLAHTSQIYPEISQISALEEIYRNKYQQIWDFGMDALTFLLDSVTPFWRTYGKTIGVDVQDFLIIPWYRNEFTGEPKRYKITRLPSRSLRHWLGLLLLPTVSSGLLTLQVRGAIYSFAWGWNFLYPNNLGFRPIFLPFLVTGAIIQWVAVFVELLIILAEAGVAVWWIGWTVGLFT